jgi:hypothetical protein
VNHWKTIRALFLAGLVAAGRQLIAILLLTGVVRVLLDNSCWTTICDSKATPPGVEVPLLAWSFLLIAMGCALTQDRFIDITADRIRQASRTMRPSNPTFASRALFAQCAIASAALATTGLTAPPILVDKVWCSAECGWFIQVIWAAAFSVGVAAFGTSAHASYRALR